MSWKISNAVKDMLTRYVEPLNHSEGWFIYQGDLCRDMGAETHALQEHFVNMYSPTPEERTLFELEFSMEYPPNEMLTKLWDIVSAVPERNKVRITAV